MSKIQVDTIVNSSDTGANTSPAVTNSGGGGGGAGGNGGPGIVIIRYLA